MSMTKYSVGLVWRKDPYDSTMELKVRDVGFFPMSAVCVPKKFGKRNSIARLTGDRYVKHGLYYALHPFDDKVKVLIRGNHVRRVRSSSATGVVPSKNMIDCYNKWRQIKFRNALLKNDIAFYSTQNSSK